MNNIIRVNTGMFRLTSLELPLNPPLLNGDLNFSPLLQRAPAGIMQWI
jgi:hypothetical protein